MTTSNIRLYSLFFCLLFFTFSCKSSDDCDSDHWSYEGSNSPERWHICHPQCSGDHQSPIDITDPVSNPELVPIELNYNEAPIHILNNGHTLQFEYPGGSYIFIDDKPYELLQFHFHTAAEHRVEGHQHPMEIHLVHMNTDMDLAVIGIMVETGEENEFLQSFGGSLPQSEGNLLQSSNTVHAEDLFPTSNGYFTYSGSLTTPGCDELVSWYIMKEPITASEEQIQMYRNIMGGNFRPVQSLNERIIQVFE